MTRPAIRTREQCILARQGMRPDGPLDHIGVHIDAAVVEEHDQSRPVPQRVAYGLRQIGDGGHPFDVILQPGMQRLDEWPTSRLPHLSSVFGGLPAYFGLKA
jgi:hypothetical protein